MNNLYCRFFSIIDVNLWTECCNRKLCWSIMLSCTSSHLPHSPFISSSLFLLYVFTHRLLSFLPSVLPLSLPSFHSFLLYFHPHSTLYTPLSSLSFLTSLPLSPSIPLSTHHSFMTGHRAAPFRDAVLPCSGERARPATAQSGLRGERGKTTGKLCGS